MQIKLLSYRKCAHRTLLLSPFLLRPRHRARYDLVFHIRAMRIISSMTTPYARHALRHARVTVEREWRILRSAAKVTVNEVYIVSLVSPREFLIKRNRYLVEFTRTDVHDCIYNETLHVACSSNLRSRIVILKDCPKIIGRAFYFRKKN